MQFRKTRFHLMRVPEASAYISARPSQMCTVSWNARHKCRSLLRMKAFSPPRAKHPALWLDMTVSVRDTGALNDFEHAFQMHRRSPLASIHADVERLQPAVAFFDFDFPTKPGLQLLRETKRDLPGLPLVMLTVQHSEALAVWAFRSRVLDYLAKPLERSEIERCVKSLDEMLVLRRAQSTPRPAAIPGATIPEEHRSGGRDGSLALAPAVS